MRRSPHTGIQRLFTHSHKPSKINLQPTMQVYNRPSSMIWMIGLWNTRSFQYNINISLLQHHLQSDRRSFGSNLESNIFDFLRVIEHLWCDRSKPRFDRTYSEAWVSASELKPNHSISKAFTTLLLAIIFHITIPPTTSPISWISTL